MPVLTTRGVVRDILTDDLDQAADDVIRKARLRGLRAPEATVREAVHKVKSVLRKARAKALAALPAPSAAHETVAPTTHADPVPVAVIPTPTPVATTPPAAPSDLTAILGNVALVNTLTVACGADNLRKAVEAVRACGGVEAFLLHLDLVAGIRSSESTK